jgi:transcriptional regulator with XRE-family HTH domain
VKEVEFSEKVRVKRAEKGLTQAELAKQAGVTQATISRIESGELTQLMSDALKRLAAALEVTVDFLVGDKSKMELEDSLAADESFRVIYRGYEKLSEEKRQQVREFVEFLKQQEKSRRKSE